MARADDATDLTVLAGATLAFDLDGTLADTAPDLVDTLNLLLADQGLAPLPFGEARRFIGHGAKRMLQRGFEAVGAPLTPERLDGLFARFLEHYSARATNRTRLYPGVAPTLEILRAAGARLCVCTNKLTGLSIQIVDALGVGPLFEAVIGADSAPAAKPDPRHLLAAIAAVGGDPRRALMIGDAATDAGAARAAKVPLVLVSFGYAETPAADLAPDALVHDYAELVPACVRLLTACSAEGSGL